MKWMVFYKIIIVVHCFENKYELRIEQMLVIFLYINALTVFYKIQKKAMQSENYIINYNSF